MSYNPAQDVFDYLEAQEVAGEESDADIFIGPLRPVSSYVPVNSLFVLATGGPPAERFLSGGAKIENRYPTVQVSVRWRTYAAGYEKARKVYDTLNFATISGYWNVTAQQSEPLFVGQDVKGNYRWSLNFALAVHSEVVDEE